MPAMVEMPMMAHHAGIAKEKARMAMAASVIVPMTGIMW